MKKVQYILLIVFLLLGAAISCTSSSDRTAFSDPAYESTEETKGSTNTVDGALTVLCVEKGFFSEGPYKNFITYRFSVKNNTDKDIRGFKGTIAFIDLFGDEVNSFEVKYDNTIISAGTDFLLDATTEYNRYREGDVELNEKDLKDLVSVWLPDKILFTDGSSFE